MNEHKLNTSTTESTTIAVLHIITYPSSVLIIQQW